MQTEEILYEIVDPILDPDLINPVYIEEFEKHQQHDQQSHGNWAGSSSEIVSDITGDMKTYFGTNLEDHLKSQGYKEITKKQEENKKDTKKGKNENENYVLEIIAEKQGFAGKPKVVSAKEMDNLEKEGWTIAYRGIANPKVYGPVGTVYTANEFSEDFRSGDYFAGAGVTGDGIYLTTNFNVARGYADSDSLAFGRGVVVKVAIPPQFTKMQSGQAKGFNRENYLDEDSFHDELESHRNLISKKGPSFRGADDIGVALAAKGIRGVKQSRDVGLVDKVEVFLIWDRSMLAVQDTNI